MYCKKCGADIADDSVFCSKCGAKQDADCDSAAIASVCVKRKSSLEYGARAVKLYIDGVYFRDMSNGEQFQTSLPLGQHTINLEVGHQSVGAAEFILRNDSDAEIAFIPSQNGIFEFYGSAVRIRADMLPRNYAPQAKQTAPAEWACLWMILGVIVFFVLLYLFLPGFAAGFHWGLRLGLGQS